MGGGGGGGDSSAGSGAAAIQADYAKQAQAQQAAYLQQALGLQQQEFNAGQANLTKYYNQAQSGLSPYALGGYNAYDAYEGTLGLGTPTGGSFALSQALNQGSKVQEQINNFNTNNDQTYRDQLMNIIDSRGKLMPWGSQEVSVNPAVRAQIAALPTANIYNLIQQYKSDAQKMIQSGSTLDPTPVQFQRNQQGDLQNWLNGLGTIQTPEQAQQAAAAQQAQLDKLKQDPNYLKYQDYQNGKIDMTQPSAGGALSQFFNTPLYQLQFGNSGAAVDPNASPLDRFQSSPGYQFQLNQGTNALEKSMASRGLLESGSFAKELDNYSQGLANQDWNNYLNRATGTFSNYQNQLSGLAGMGAQTSGLLSNMAVGQGSNLANLGMNYANNAGNIYGALGTGAANSLLAQGGALAGGLINNYNAGQVQNASQMQGLGALGGLFSSFGGGGGMGGGMGGGSSSGGQSGGGFNTSGALGGAASGASSGMAFGPWGAVAGGVLGGLMGGFS